MRSHRGAVLQIRYLHSAGNAQANDSGYSVVIFCQIMSFTDLVISVADAFIRMAVITPEPREVGEWPPLVDL